MGAICEIVSAAVPELLNVSETAVWLPVCTDPKFRVAGFAVSWPPVDPVPDRGTFRVEFTALLVIARLPVMLPVACGANVKL